MLSTKPLLYHFRVLPIGLLWLSSTLALRAEFVLSAETDPPKATVAELAKASYAEEKTLKTYRLHSLTQAQTQKMVL